MRLGPPGDAGRPRRVLPARAALLTAAAAVAVAVVAPGLGWAAAASPGWTISLTPTTIEADQATTIKATFANLGGPDGQQDLGCVRIAIPATFTVQSTVVVDEPPDTTWKASSSGLTTVTINTASGGDRLPPGNPSASVTTSIKVSALLPGTYTWTANAYRSQDCTQSFNEPIRPSVLVKLTLLPTPSAVPTPTPTPAPTAPPLPTLVPSLPPLPTILPVPTPTPRPTSAETPPSGTPGPTQPGATPTPPDGSSPPSTGAPTRPPGSSGPPSGPADPSSDPSPASSPPIGAGLVIPGAGPGDGSTGGGSGVSLTSGFTTPFGDGFAWAVPGLVLSVPGLLIVLFAIVAQAFGALAWLPVVRRRIGGFDVRRDPAPPPSSRA